MGGVHTDLDGRTSIPGVYAAGEVACSGVHGANRLASNSLLEGLVFGARAGRAMSTQPPQRTAHARRAVWTVPDIAVSELRDLAWQNCGILRDRDGLESAIATLAATSLRSVGEPSLPAIELRNIFEAVSLIAQSALWREESRGAHYRSDFPARQAAFARDSSLNRA